MGMRASVLRSWGATMGPSTEVEGGPPWTGAELAELNRRFAGQPAEALLDWATGRYRQEIVLTCSFGGPSGMVLLDMIARLDRGTPVVFLDTDLLFAETYALVEQVRRRYGVEVRRRQPAITLGEQERLEGPQLFRRDPDRCCAIRKVAPLAEALRPYQAWISGIRRDQAPTRAEAGLVEWSDRHQLLKLNPLVHWSERDVWRYIYRHSVPYNPLHDRGYPSLGCTPCTNPAGAESPRSGRWSGFSKTECGIHL